MFFFGEFPYQIDDRNRVPIPPPFRSAFDSGIIVAPGVEPCITLYTKEAFEAEVEGVRRLPKEMPYVRNATRHIFPRVRLVEKLDGQGRISIDAKMLADAGIEKEVVVVGTDTSLEIWDRVRWEEGDGEREAAHERALEEAGAWRTSQLTLVGGRG